MYQQRTDLYNKQTPRPLAVFRYQLMSADELNLRHKSMGGLISMNSFFSMTLKRQMALDYLGSPPFNDGFQRVLFEIQIPLIAVEVWKPFAEIQAESDFEDGEAEILFMIGSIFRLKNIREENGIVFVELVLCNSSDPHVNDVREHMHDEMKESNLLSLCEMLLRAGKFTEGELYIERLLKGLPQDDPL